MSESDGKQFMIWKCYSFDAAHRLECVESGHPCGKLHGHTYRVRIECSGPLNEGGMIVDYAEIDRKILPIIGRLDHSNLNSELNFETTAENLASWFYEMLKTSLPIHAVEVSETDDSGARYSL